MRILIILLTAGIIVMVAASAVAGGMRCRNDIIDIGDSTFFVIKSCGAPISKQHIGYTVNGELKRELVIEEWVFGPRNNYFYFLTMIGGKVAEIRSER